MTEKTKRSRSYIFVSRFVEDYRAENSTSPTIPEVYEAGKRKGYSRAEITVGLIEHISRQKFDQRFSPNII